MSLGSVADAAKPFVVALVARLTGRPLVLVTHGSKPMESLHNDLTAFVPEALLFPSWESLPHVDRLPTVDTVAQRLKVVGRLHQADHPPVVVTCVQALMQRTVSASQFGAASLTLRVGDQRDLHGLADQLVALGYQPEHQATERGDMAVRGGILDVYPLDRDEAVRLEFFGDDIESIRAFDPVSQKSTDRLEAITILPAGEVGLIKQSAELGASLVAMLPAKTLVVWDEPDQLLLAADEYARQSSADNPYFVPWSEIVKAPLQRVDLTGEIDFEEETRLNLRVPGLDAWRAIGTQAPEPEIAEQTRRAFFDQVRQWRDQGWTVRVVCGTEGECRRFEELWAEQFQSVPVGLKPELLALSRGFIWPDAKLVVVTDAEIFGRYKLARPRHSFHKMAQPSDWTELQEGDFVVHLQHGIGKYRGLETIEEPAPGDPLKRVTREVLVVEFANEARLFVPVDQAHLVSKYIGAGKRAPNLHELGGALWGRQKQSAERSIMDLASNLLEVQAARASLQGHAFAVDTPWQAEFEAAFPYDATPDQVTAIADVKRDMETPRPMDRLLCGDVGYGKTEVAVRAAFKAVMGGFQVAVLVPTTVLAEQHYNTFRERMAGFPVTVEMLSRFRTAGEQKRVVEMTRAGGVDILIGTHRLLSADVQFKNLGLVVIDEEQRFGVLHKEKFKQLRKLVDVLTLSATPIPRTLYMALTGAREMSTIQTPPQDRLPVETIIGPYDERVIRQAIQRELNRGGQVYFLHNRVQSIDMVAGRLQQLLEDFTVNGRKVRIDVGHGQMNEHQLENVMHRFVAGQLDVLVCTTIIESGLDIPNANTIIIDRADRFGLADLYQLRGRVGRYRHQAYAYILLPRHMQLVQTARKRISALRQYSSLGSGFKIAMRDLEIRGAGNILGPEQSGHISAIGFDLYCQLLKESIGRLKGEKTKRPPHVVLKLDFLSHDGDRAAVPVEYIDDARLRIEVYRKIAACADEGDVEAMRGELRDRFGKVPKPVRFLLDCAAIRIKAAAVGIDTVETREDKIMLSSRGNLHQVDGRFPRFTRTGPADKLRELARAIDDIARATSARATNPQPSRGVSPDKSRDRRKRQREDIQNGTM